jgi:N12 class adenine-specific DNA methylase
MQITPYQAKYNAYALTSRQDADGVGNISQSLFDACVDLNPHQVDAALFACQNPLSQGVILADEVGLGKTIEAGLVISQRWAERRRRILIIVPANLRKQWHQELQEKFALECLLLEAKNYNAMRKQQTRSPFDSTDQPVRRDDGLFRRSSGHCVRRGRLHSEANVLLLPGCYNEKGRPMKAA